MHVSLASFLLNPCLQLQSNDEVRKTLRNEANFTVVMVEFLEGHFQFRNLKAYQLLHALPGMGR